MIFMRKKRTYFIPVLLLLIALSLGVSSCNIITGEAVKSTSSLPRWGWSTDNNGNSFIIDRNTQQPIRDITPDEAFGIIGTSEYLGVPVIIDVRTPQEYAAGYIRDAINIDYNSPTFRDEIGKLDKNKIYIIYCRSGGRSAAARDAMAELGFREIHNMTGGILEWEAEGLPVVK